MNKNLMAIFHTEFRQNDIVENIVTKKKASYFTSQVLGWHKQALVHVTKDVSLVEVLEKLRAKHNRFFQVHPNYNIDKTVTIRMYEQKKNIDWLLSDKSGEVPLHRQSKETQRALLEILS